MHQRSAGVLVLRIAVSLKLRKVHVLLMLYSFGLQVHSSGIRASGFGSRIYGLGFRVWQPGMKDRDYWRSCCDYYRDPFLHSLLIQFQFPPAVQDSISALPWWAAYSNRHRSPAFRFFPGCLRGPGPPLRAISGPGGAAPKNATKWLFGRQRHPPSQGPPRISQLSGPIRSLSLQDRPARGRSTAPRTLSRS